MQRIITFKMPVELLERLDAYASRRGMARSEVIREAIIALLAREAYISRQRKTISIVR
jgi:metal-responsive CopG/Arc/MetJ family transcriptional regulator